MTASPITILDESVLAEAHRQAIAAKRDPRAYLVEKTRLGLMLALGMKADLGVEAAARYLGIHRNSLLNYRKRGLLPNAYSVSARKLMIPLADLENLKAGMQRKQKKAVSPKPSTRVKAAKKPVKKLAQIPAPVPVVTEPIVGVGISLPVMPGTSARDFIVCPPDDLSSASRYSSSKMTERRARKPDGLAYLERKAAKRAVLNHAESLAATA